MYCCKILMFLQNYQTKRISIISVVCQSYIQNSQATVAFRFAPRVFGPSIAATPPPPPVPLCANGDVSLLAGVVADIIDVSVDDGGRRPSSFTDCEKNMGNIEET